MTFMLLAGLSMVVMADRHNTVRGGIGAFLIAAMIADFLLIAYGIDAWKGK